MTIINNDITINQTSIALGNTITESNAAGVRADRAGAEGYPPAAVAIQQAEPGQGRPRARLTGCATARPHCWSRRAPRCPS